MMRMTPKGYDIQCMNLDTRNKKFMWFRGEKLNHFEDIYLFKIFNLCQL